MRPYFVDNQEGNTLAHAIVSLLKDLRGTGKHPDELCIATAYFNPQGLDLIAHEARHLGRIRLLLGAVPEPESSARRRTPKDPPEPAYTKKRIAESLQRLERSLKDDRNRLPFIGEMDEAIRHLLDFLKSGQIEVRRFEDQFLHAKAFVLRGNGRGVLSGSSNLTFAGMSRNLELNLGYYDDPLLERVESWYDDLWNRAVPFNLAEIYEELFRLYDPYLVYLKVLWHLYNEELMEEEKETGHIPVTDFQRHGVWRARKIMEKFGGVLIADGVGLGKTFSAGAIMADYRERRQRILLICPAALRDTTWKKFLSDYQLQDADCVSYEQLAGDKQMGGANRNLLRPLDEYQLVVVDEAHNYRNPDAPTRAAILRRLLSGKRRDLLLLSATPVNNSLWDLYHMLHFFMRQDAALADRGVLSLRQRFIQAMREDPFDLNPDLLYPVIDATTVKRTRRFVKKHYENDQVRGPGGIMVPIKFPKPVASTIEYDLDRALPGFCERLGEILMPENADPLLTMGRYQPEKYLPGGVPNAPESALVGLLRSGLLKRFESSVDAFRRTVRRMKEQHEAFLEALDGGRVPRKEFFEELASDGDLEIDEILDRDDLFEDAKPYDVKRLRADAKADLVLFSEMEKTVGVVTIENDPKLEALIEALGRIASEAKKEAIDAEDEMQKRKVLVFSHYEETIDWIEERLTRALKSDKRLAAYRDRTASVSGEDSRNGVNREKAIFGFAPVSTESQEDDLFDLLLCTDVLAEGMNLQQCRNIINYDLPWNPMRLVQRHGRVDRIGSPHKNVFLKTFFPAKQLDALLNLEERVRRKLAQAAASVGVEDAPIVGGRSGEQSFTETREEIERLSKGDASIYETGGDAGAAQTGEEYRQELRKALEKFGNRIESLPWRMGSIRDGAPRTGHFFCASVGERLYLRFVPSAEDQPIEKEIGTCLRLIECEEGDRSVEIPAIQETAHAAWARARADILAAWMFETDPANLQPRIGPLYREVESFLRERPPADIEPERYQRALDTLLAPWPKREERVLRDAWESEFDNALARAKMLIETIERVGASPFHAPEPLPPIGEDEIHLVAWMGLRAKA